jgi:hypothetical protein
MRIGGAFLLVCGSLLCLTVAMAAIGFVAMGLGLICFLIAEERDKRATLAPPAVPVEQAHGQDQDQKPDVPVLASPPETQETDQAPVAAVAVVAPGPEHPELPAGPSEGRAPRRRAEADSPAYDLEKWHSAVRADPDLLRAVAALAALGKKYVDQLASAYLAFEEKAYFPIIFKMVAAKARKDSGRKVAMVFPEAEFNGELFDLPSGKLREHAFAGSPFEDAGTIQPRSSDGSLRSAPKFVSPTHATRDVPGLADDDVGPNSDDPDTAPVVAGQPRPRVVLADAEDGQNLADWLDRIQAQNLKA